MPDEHNKVVFRKKLPDRTNRTCMSFEVDKIIEAGDQILELVQEVTSGPTEAIAVLQLVLERIMKEVGIKGCTVHKDNPPQ